MGVYFSTGYKGQGKGKGGPPLSNSCGYFSFVNAPKKTGIAEKGIETKTCAHE